MIFSEILIHKKQNFAISTDRIQNCLHREIVPFADDEIQRVLSGAGHILSIPVAGGFYMSYPA